jgi:hypothetical protein
MHRRGPDAPEWYVCFTVGEPQWRHEGVNGQPESQRRLDVVSRIGMVLWCPGDL